MSFLGGFSQSLGNYFTQRAAADEERKDWEWKQKKVLELQAQQPTKVELFQKGDEVFAQPVNSANEPVGAPRPATQFERVRHERGETEYTTTQELNKARLEREQAGTRASNAQLGLAEAELGYLPQREARAEAESKDSRATSGAYAGAAAEQARGARLDNDIKQRLFDRATGLAEAGDYSVLEALGAGGRRAADPAAPASDKSIDVARVDKIATEVLNNISQLPETSQQSYYTRRLEEIQALPNSVEKIEALTSLRAEILLTASGENGGANPGVNTTELAAQSYGQNFSPVGSRQYTPPILLPQKN